jgi:hypothetical protein
MTFPAVARKKIREGVERGSALILGRAGAPAFAWASAVAEAMADKPARQGWRRGRLWRDTEPAVTGVPRVKFFFKCDLVRFGAIWCYWAARSSKFKVQSPRFKVQGSRCSPEVEEAKIAGLGRHPARSSVVGSLFSL